MKKLFCCRQAKKYFMPMVLILLISTFPVWFLFLQNTNEITLSQIVIPLLIYAATGLVALLFSILVLRRKVQGGIIAVLWTVALLNFSYIDSFIRAIFPAARYWHSLIVLVVALFYISPPLSRLDDDLCKIISQIVSAVTAGLLAVNCVTAAVDYASRKPASQSVIPQVDVQVASSKGSKPNVYFLLYDEYSSNKVLKEHYGYDNSKFTDMLQSLGFYVSYTSRNDSCDTKTVMTNLMNLNYIVNDETPLADKEKLWNDNSLMKQLFEKSGYKFLGAGDSAVFSIRPVGSDVPMEINVGKTVDGRTSASILIDRTFFSIFTKLTLGNADPAATLNQSHSAYFQLWQTDSTYDNDGGIFWFGYLILPHQPFIYTSNGSPVDSSNHNDWSDERYYLGQLIYTTKLISQQVRTIVQKDPDSIIVLQSDHSARRLDNDTLNFTIASSNCFNAVYYRGENVEQIDGLSSVNTWRAIINRLLGTTFEPLDLPAYYNTADRSNNE